MHLTTATKQQVFRLLNFVGCALMTTAGWAQSPPRTTSRPQFEVISVTPCRGADLHPDGQGRGGGFGRITSPPGRLNAECVTTDDLIRDAFLLYADGKPWPLNQSGTRRMPVSSRLLEQKIEGSPAWLDTDRYTVDARADGTPTREMMRGPMLQSLLADRFQLKIHRKSRPMPVYELRVTKAGPGLERAVEGGCITVDRDHPPPFRVQGRPLPRVCGGWAGDSIYGTTMANLCREISVFSDRDIIDKTGIAGAFNIHFDSLLSGQQGDAIPDGMSDPSGVTQGAQSTPATVFASLQDSLRKVGLTLLPAKSSGEFLVIDYVEKPSEN